MILTNMIHHNLYYHDLRRMNFLDSYCRAVHADVFWVPEPDSRIHWVPVLWRPAPLTYLNIHTVCDRCTQIYGARLQVGLILWKWLNASFQPYFIYVVFLCLSSPGFSLCRAKVWLSAEREDVRNMACIYPAGGWRLLPILNCKICRCKANTTQV